MIWPGVISMGMPRSGVAGLWGSRGLVGVVTMEDSVERETGEVGRLTVTGTLVFRVKLLVSIVLVKLLVLTTTGLMASILRPSAPDTSTSLCTLEEGSTSFC